MNKNLHVVTGAFGYSGRYMAHRLLDRGMRVRTLTNSRRSDPFAGKVEAAPLAFHDPDALARSLEGAKVLYNTYWVRFDHDDFSHSAAVGNTLAMFAAAKRAGVERIVHVSITNPSIDSSLPYFRGKAELEAALKASGMSYAILRPAVLFGREDILVNNIAWMLRRMPVFGVFGDGAYQIQPIYVDDLATLAVESGERTDNITIDAIGPETFTYRAMVEMIAEAIHVRRKIVSVSPGLGYALGRAMGWWLGDVVLTREEIQGLMEGRLATASPPAGSTRLSEWTRAHAHEVGMRYANELARRRDRTRDYMAQ